jgi:hypothetical protein
MSINEYSALASIVAATCAIPAAFYYILKIKKLFNFRRKQKLKTTNIVPSKKIPHQISINLIHMFALLGVAFIIISLIETTIRVPQAGFGGPAPRWVSSLIFMPISGFLISWIFVNLADTYYYLYPNDFKIPFTQKRRTILSIIIFLLGMSLPWLYTYLDTFIPSALK